MPERRRCYLCEYYGSRREFITKWLNNNEHIICGVCWDTIQDIDGAVMAKRAKAKAKQPKVARKSPVTKPCAKCGRNDFENDYARRGHQGKCTADPEEAAEVDQDKPKKTRAQVGRGSRNKGNSYENHIKKILAKWYGEPEQIIGTKASLFQRTPGSGGASPTNWPLDLHVPKNFPWAVECKNREAHGMESMERFLTADKYPVIQWFKEAEEELTKVGIQKPLLLVFTRNNFPDFVAFRRPVSNNGLHLSITVKHMTICDRPFGELIVMTLDNMTIPTLGYWVDAYKASSPQSVMPRRWSC